MGTNINQKKHSIRTIALASSIGATIEWYDFFLYGTVASIVFNKLFFPAGDPVTATISAYVAFCVGYIARPMGGLIFGHFGDKIGRKTVLVITLLLMGLATFCMGLLPTYQAWGWWATGLLIFLRLLQGIAVGGEWAGAVLMSVEHAGENQKGFYGSWPQVGVPAGLSLAAGVVALLGLLPNDSFMDWGWRVAFLISIVLVAIGIYVRISILETPDFTRVKEEEEVSAMPFFELLKTEPKNILLGMGARYIEGMCFVTYGVFSIAYMTNYLHMPRTQALLGVIIAAVIMMPMLPFFGWLSDKIGRKKVFFTASILSSLLVFPAFWWLEAMKGSYWAVIAIIIPFSLVYPALYGPQAALFSELFKPRVRYTGISFVYQFSGIFAVGITPIVYLKLIEMGNGKPWLVCTYFAIVGVISAISVTLMHTTSSSKKELKQASQICSAIEGAGID